MEFIFRMGLKRSTLFREVVKSQSKVKRLLKMGYEQCWRPSWKKLESEDTPLR